VCLSLVAVSSSRLAKKAKSTFQMEPLSSTQKEASASRSLVLLSLICILGIVTPGFIDVHAHWNGHFGWPFPLPARDWQHVAFLAYGVTTLHNPSFDNAGGYIERALVESGRIIAPRIVHTGGVIYGADATGLHHEIVDMDQAREALTRIKAEGGPASFSYKNYQLPSRAARQRLLLTAKNMSMLAVPEGGMNSHWDLTYIADGMATVEVRHLLVLAYLKMMLTCQRSTTSQFQFSTTMC